MQLKLNKLKGLQHLYFLLIFIFCQIVSLSCQNKRTTQDEKTQSAMNDSTDYNSKAKNLALNLKRKGIKDETVLDAISKVPRHVFVSTNLANRAYEDKPLPIDRNQTISQPYTVAFQSELLQVQTGEKVLEIGTGSGYQAAILCEMGAEVYSIERHQQLYIKAKETLQELGYNPILIYGDGYEGLPDHAPFDKILITAATKEFPKKLLQQLKIGGLMVAPIGDGNSQTMTVVKRLGENEYTESEHGTFVFVPILKGTED